MALTEKSRTQKSVLISVLAVASLLLVIAFCGRYCANSLKVFYHVGNFLLGTFGMAFYGIAIGVIVFAAMKLYGKQVQVPKRYVANFIAMFAVVVLLVQLFTTSPIYQYYESDGQALTYGTYVDCVYNYYSVLPTIGGVVFGSFTFALRSILSFVGAIVVLVAGLGVTVYFAGCYFYDLSTGKIALENFQKQTETEPEQSNVEVSAPAKNTIEDERENAMNILFQEQTIDETESEQFDVAEKSSLDENDKIVQALFGEEDVPEPKTNAFFDDGDNEDDFIVRAVDTESVTEIEQKTEDEPAINVDGGWYNEPARPISTIVTDEVIAPQGSAFVDDFDESEGAQQVAEEEQTPAVQTETISDEEFVGDDEVDVADAVTYDEDEDDEEEFTEESEEKTETVNPYYADPDYSETVDVQPDPTDYFDNAEPVLQTVLPKSNVVKEEDLSDLEGGYVAVSGGTKIDDTHEQMGFNIMPNEELEQAQNTVIQYGEYVAPPLELLNDATIVADVESEERISASQAIVNKLHNFGIDVEAVAPIVGPTVTRYLFKPLSEKTRMSDFERYDADLKSCLATENDIIIQAPVPGTSYVGIEVANKVRTPVALKTILQSDEFTKSKGDLVFAIGQGITGDKVVSDLGEMPHMLIAGSTGSGKSVCLNDMIVSLVYKYSPEYLRFIMIDPKCVELSRYNGLPHMLMREAITTGDDAVAGLNYLAEEMEARFQLFKTSHVSNIAEYNKHIDPRLKQKLPHIVLIVDELADLMQQRGKDIETTVSRIAAKSRAAGIHIVFATQSPRKEVVTGLIKSNIGTKMALRTTSIVESKIVIDYSGSEKLLGRGDMLFRQPGEANYKRIQGALVTNDEIYDIVKFITENNKAYFDDSIEQKIMVSREIEKNKEIEKQLTENGGNGDGDTVDAFCRKALRYWLEYKNGQASISSIQRGLSIGFNRAGRIMETLQALNYVERAGDSESNTKPRKVTVTLEDLPKLFPDQDDTL